MDVLNIPEQRQCTFVTWYVSQNVINFSKYCNEALKLSIGTPTLRSRAIILQTMMQIYFTTAEIRSGIEIDRQAGQIKKMSMVFGQNNSVHVKMSTQTFICSISIGSACTSWSFGSLHCNSLSSWFSWKYFTPVYRLTWSYSI